MGWGRHSALVTDRWQAGQGCCSPEMVAEEWKRSPYNSPPHLHTHIYKTHTHPPPLLFPLLSLCHHSSAGFTIVQVFAESRVLIKPDIYSRTVAKSHRGEQDLKGMGMLTFSDCLFEWFRFTGLHNSFSIRSRITVPVLEKNLGKTDVSPYYTTPCFLYTKKMWFLCRKIKQFQPKLEKQMPCYRAEDNDCFHGYFAWPWTHQQPWKIASVSEKGRGSNSPCSRSTISGPKIHAVTAELCMLRVTHVHTDSGMYNMRILSRIHTQKHQLPGQLKVWGIYI